MISNLQYLGIYESAINSAIDTVENAFTSLGMENKIDVLNKEAVYDLCQVGDWNNITNSIIYAYFSTAKAIINNEKPELEIDYYINCDDSHFYIDGEEQ